MSDFFLEFVPPAPEDDKPKGRNASPRNGWNAAQQFGTGASEGIAGMLGLPVDALTGAINAAGGLVRGADAPPLIENPVGGSQSIEALLSPFMAQEGPQTGLERYGRRVGQEVGAGAVPLGVAARGAQAVAPLVGLDLASSVGSGVAGQAAEDMGGGATAQLVASLAGGLAPIGASRAMTPSPRAPSIDQAKAAEEAAWGRVDQSTARLAPQNRDAMVAAVQNRTRADDLDALLHPRANRMVERMDALPPDPTLGDVNRLRRVIGRDVAGSTDAGEARIGMGMKEELDAYLESLAAQAGPGDPMRAGLDDLVAARGQTRRVKAAEGLQNVLDSGSLRAAVSGTGGNEVNAIRQNMRRILENPKLSRSYTPDELKAIDDLARGTPSVNAARLIGRLSPDSGAIPLMMNMASIAGGGAAVPGAGLMAGAVPGLVGIAAKKYAEHATQKGVEQLIAEILAGGAIPRKSMTDTQTRALAALLAGQAANASP